MTDDSAHRDTPRSTTIRTNASTPEPLEEDTHTAAETNLRASSVRADSLFGSTRSLKANMASPALWGSSAWRHYAGLGFLLVTVFLWTASNFLASTIFADNTYSKPYFVTYVNSSFFVLPLIPLMWRKWKESPEEIIELRDWILRRQSAYTPLEQSESQDQDSHKATTDDLLPTVDDAGSSGAQDHLRAEVRITSLDPSDKLTLLETVKIALPFCLLWFFANYFAVACLEYTTVGSATILTSTSSIWTLIAGHFFGVERFTLRKLLGVVASLAGVALISSIDISSSDDKDRGSFPHKTAHEIAIGDFLAFLSALVYGLYALYIKRRIGDESRANMPLFFGLVGLLNVLLLWPGFFLLHVTNIESFALPPSAWISTIILCNSASSLISDISWALAMLLTSPLVVTVGLSLTIPLSLVGQQVMTDTHSGWLYWLGAIVVVGSFVFVEQEEKREEEPCEATVVLEQEGAQV